MSTRLRLATAFMVAFMAAQTRAQTRPFGFGVIGGEPVGATIKVWFNPYIGMDLAAGADFGPESRRPFPYDMPPGFQTHIEILGHLPVVRTNTLRMPVYIGVGPKVSFRAGFESVRARTPVGVCLLWPRTPFPWEFFVEFAPSWGPRPLPFDPDLAAGIRYYF